MCSRLGDVTSTLWEDTEVKLALPLSEASLKWLRWCFFNENVSDRIFIIRFSVLNSCFLRKPRNYFVCKATTYISTKLPGTIDVYNTDNFQGCLKQNYLLSNLTCVLYKKIYSLSWLIGLLEYQ